MLTNAFSKIPVNYLKGLRIGLLWVSLISFVVGLILFIPFNTKTETITKESGHLFWKKTKEITIHHDLSERMPYLIWGIILLIIAVICFFIALKLMLLTGRYKKYSFIIKGTDQLSIQQIADMSNSDPRQVTNDLQNMINSNYINGYYIDYKQGVLVDKNHILEKMEKKIVKCHSCGANNEVVIAQSNYCKYCDSLIIP